MNLFIIDISTPKGNVYFRTEEKYFESMEKCLDYFIQKYPDCNFEIKEYGGE